MDFEFSVQALAVLYNVEMKEYKNCVPALLVELCYWGSV